METYIYTVFGKKIPKLIKFNCVNCGHFSCHRPQEMQNLSLLEGSFECDRCATRYNYADDALFIRNLTRQLELF